GLGTVGRSVGLGGGVGERVAVGRGVWVSVGLGGELGLTVAVEVGRDTVGVRLGGTAAGGWDGRGVGVALGRAPGGNGAAAVVAAGDGAGRVAVGRGFVIFPGPGPAGSGGSLISEWPTMPRYHRTPPTARTRKPKAANRVTPKLSMDDTKERFF